MVFTVTFLKGEASMHNDFGVDTNNNAVLDDNSEFHQGHDGYNHSYNKLEDFSNPHMYDPQDLSLFLGNDIDREEIDPRILEVYLRFYSINFIHDHGHKCFFMSYLLKKILRYHGLPAHVKQVKMSYTNVRRGWRTRVGWPMQITHEGVVDTHCVVTVNGYILDWATIGAIYNNFGAMSPRGFIVRDIPGKIHKHEFFGELKYEDRPNHKFSNNIRLDQKKNIEFMTSYYFGRYLV